MGQIKKHLLLSGFIIIILGAASALFINKINDRKVPKGFYEVEYLDQSESYLDYIKENKIIFEKSKAVKVPEREVKYPQVIKEFKGANDSIVQLIYKDTFTYWNDKNATSSEQIIQVLYKDGTSKELLHLTPDHYPARIGALDLSPQGTYLYYLVMFYEGSTSQIVNVLTGNYLLLSEETKYSADFPLWSSDESFVTFVTFYSEFDGSGSNAVWVSDKNNPEKINKIFEFGGQENYIPAGMPNSEIKKVDNIRIEDNLVLFDAYNSSDFRINYKYNVITKELTSY